MKASNIINEAMTSGNALMINDELRSIKIKIINYLINDTIMIEIRILEGLSADDNHSDYIYHLVISEELLRNNLSSIEIEIDTALSYL